MIAKVSETRKKTKIGIIKMDELDEGNDSYVHAHKVSIAIHLSVSAELSGHMLIDPKNDKYSSTICRTSR